MEVPRAGAPCFLTIQKGKEVFSVLRKMRLFFVYCMCAFGSLFLLPGMGAGEAAAFEPGYFPPTGQQPASPWPVILFAVCGCVLVIVAVILVIFRKKRSGSHFRGASGGRNNKE